MKRWMNWKRLLAFTTASAMMLALFASCGGDSKTDDGVLENGNVLTATEQGSEKELTAVRDKLIKQSEITGLGDITKMELYENGVRTASDEYVQVRDNKKLYWSDGYKRVVNYPDGYILDIPDDWQVDFTMTTARSVFYNDTMQLTVSDETDSISVYGSSENAVKEMFRLINTEEYCEKNRVRKISENTTELSDGFKMYVLKMELMETLEGTFSFYTYVVFYSEMKITYMMFKCIDGFDFVDTYCTYQSIYDKGTAIDIVSYPESANPSWNDETKALYDEIQSSQTVKWGMVNGNLDDDPLKRKYPLLEKKLDHKFEVVTSYTDRMAEAFPLEEAKKIDADGRIIQYTYHFDYDFGNTVGQNAPVLDVYRGELDEEFRAFARDVVEFGRPMLFRVNNEMNSDWTSWSAVNAMNDPDIFTETWKRMYNIFEEEGANAYLIWIWNPSGCKAYPVMNWNDTRLFFPGAKYVDMLGLSSYNFGDEEEWKTFDTLYTRLNDYYAPLFGDWAWIIAEFGCSDSSQLEEHEGRRSVWIKEMFDCFEQNKFPNIKVAVWFNANDYDAAGNITHEISLGRDSDAQQAFKEGLDRTQP